MKGPTEDFWQMAGVALIILSLCLGEASCVIGDGWRDRLRSDRTAPGDATAKPSKTGSTR